MEEKMDSDRSISGDSSSSSDSSSGSSDGDEDPMEPVRILGTTLELPQELCENYELFKELFSMKTWESLDEEHKEHLKKFLPKFEENEEEETEKTIKMLFDFEPFHFTSPLDVFFSNLKQGNYRPDIAKMRKFLFRARSKQQKHKVKSYYAKLLPEVLITRERILRAAKSAPPGPAPRVPSLPLKPSAKNNFKPVYLRAKQRYFEELAAVRTEVGGVDTDDENYPDGPPEPSFKKRKQVSMGPNGDCSISGTMSSSEKPQPSSLQCLKNALAAHRARRQHRENHPELNTSGITLEDIKQRVAMVNGTKKLMFGGQKVVIPVQRLKRGPKKDKQKASDSKVMKKCKEEADGVENKPLLPNIKIKCEREESDSESSSFVDPITSPMQIKKAVEPVEIKQEVVDQIPIVSNSSFDPALEIKEELPDVIPVPCNSKMPVHQPVPIKLEDLDGIDMMALPVEIAGECGEVIQVDATADEVLEGETVVEVDESLTETTHANFLSLVRALFPARDAHRASKQQLHARCSAVMRSPIAPLNTWYSLLDDWCSELDSALDYLAGEKGSHPEDFVPYLQYMPEAQVGSEEPVKIYQWIGAGRDCDSLLGRLCDLWLRASSPQPTIKEPPPPKCPTSWTVRPPTNEEICEFRGQERRRFASAARPFTYVQHGYRSTVGPCARAGGACGGAGAALLTAERPRHVSFAALVRDALARLPNGEGSRHDVFTLIMMSQYLSECSDQALMNAVSTVLERLGNAKRDPAAKYDHRTSIWTYLHRNKTEEDWMIKTPAGRRAARALAAPPAGPSPSPPAPSPPPDTALSATKDVQPLSPHGMDLEVAGVEEVIEASDSDVDVDDSSLPTSSQQLSSAQLLMQATLTQVKQPAPTKPKKQTPTPPQKRSYTPKQTVQTKQTKTALMTQSVKQATLLAQSVKQFSIAQSKANVLQAVKTTIMKQTVIVQAPKASISQAPKLIAQVPKQTTVTKPTIKAPPKVNVKLPVQSPKQTVASPKQPPQSPKPSPQSPMQPPQSPKPPPSPKPPQSPKLPAPSPKPVASTSVIKTVVGQSASLPVLTQTTITKALPSVIATTHKSPLIKQRPLLKSEPNIVTVSKVQVPSNVIITQSPTPPTVIQPIASASILQTQNKVVTQGTRSLLIRPPAMQTTVTATMAPTTQAAAARRGVVRVLSPANPSSGKSLISPRALLQDSPVMKKRIAASSAISASTGAPLQSSAGSAAAPRTVQLAGGRTVQLAASQTVHLPGGQAVQLSSGHTLQLSSMQLPTHSVRLPSGQTVQLATTQAMQAFKASVASPRNQSPRAQTAIKTSQSIQVPISTVQLAGQTVQIAGQTVQLAGQSVQLTGHTVKLPSGQSVQIASQSVMPSSVQLPSGQTVQLASGNVQTVQIAGSNMQLAGQSMQIQTSGQNMQLGHPQSVQIGGQTVQIASGQSVQIPGGQTIQLPGGQTVQLSSGQALQLASGQTVQLASQSVKSLQQVVRSQNQGEKSASGQPIVAKLLTNAQGQMVSLESLGGSGRTIVSGIRPRPSVRVLSPATRLTRPLMLSAKPLHNIILQQGDGTIRVPSTGGASTPQTIVISNITTQTVATTTTATPVLKLQQVTPLQQVKLAQGMRLQQPISSAGVTTTSGLRNVLPISSASVATSGVRSVLMDGQQLKLVGGRHVLARILRPAHPPNQ